MTVLYLSCVLPKWEQRRLWYDWIEIGTLYERI